MRTDIEQTAFVIWTLDDSIGKSIDYKNRFWLRKNVKMLDIRVCVEDCNVDLFKIARDWRKEGHFVIQDGKKVENERDFDFKKEALFLIQYKNHCLVFLYYPKD